MPEAAVIWHWLIKMDANHPSLSWGDLGRFKSG